MRILLSLFLVLILHSAAIGQKISYKIPQGYEQDISKADYKRLVDMAVPLVAKRYKIDHVKDGTITLKQGQEMQALNLDNLILKCAEVEDRSQWEKVVQVHFENLFASIDEQKKIDPVNFETIKNYLSIRLYPASVVEQRGGAENLVTKTDLEGTLSLLMLDLPGAFTSVQREYFDLWGKDLAEVFGIAQENVNKQEIEKVTQSFDFDGTQVEITFLGNEDYAASYALGLMSNSPDLVGEWGSVVAVPNKGLVEICKITKSKPLDFVIFIQRTKPLVETSYREHMQPVSDQYYWYYQGQFVKIDVQTDAAGAINVVSPMGLSQLMTERK